MSSAASLSLLRIILVISACRDALGVLPASVCSRRKSALIQPLIMEAGQVVAVRLSEPQILPVRRSISAQLRKPLAGTGTFTVAARNCSGGNGGGVGLGVGVGFGPAGSEPSM